MFSFAFAINEGGDYYIFFLTWVDLLGCWRIETTFLYLKGSVKTFI